jgi:ABC-type transporter Mla maintaining outer membrane lipid asymmetry ATPase subunit MlaF
VRHAGERGTRTPGGALDGKAIMADHPGTLELDGLCRRYGNVVALDGLSFTVPPGQVFGFLGPNGAGKSNIGL